MSCLLCSSVCFAEKYCREKKLEVFKKKKPSFLQRKITSRFLSFKRIDAPCSLTNIHASVLWKFSSKKDKTGASPGILIVFNSMSHSFAALSHEISSWTLEEKFHISTRPCIVLYITSGLCPENRWCNHVNLPYVWILAQAYTILCVFVLALRASGGNLWLNWGRKTPISKWAGITLIWRAFFVPCGKKKN